MRYSAHPRVYVCVCVSQKKDRPFFWGEGDGLTVLHTDDDRCALWQPSFLRKYRLNEFLTNSSPLLEIHISNELCIWREGGEGMFVLMKRCSIVEFFGGF